MDFQQYLNAGTGRDCALHNKRTSWFSRVRTIFNSSASLIFGLTLPTGSIIIMWDLHFQYSIQFNELIKCLDTYILKARMLI